MASKKQKTAQARSNLARTALGLLASKVQFDYQIDGAYAPVDSHNHYNRPSDFKSKDASNEAIKVCLAGFGPIALNNGRHYSNGWWGYIEGAYPGISTIIFTRPYVSPKKKYTKLDVAKRVLHYLDTDTVASSRVYTRKSKARTIQELTQYLVK